MLMRIIKGFMNISYNILLKAFYNVIELIIRLQVIHTAIIAIIMQD
jgi:hypothetical protein